MSDHTTVVEEHHEVDYGQAWQGGDKPLKSGYGKLMMWYFLLSDAFTFSGFLIAYAALRFSSPTWPEADFVFSTFPGGFHHMPLIFVTVMTFILILSSVTMVRAVQEGKRENKNGVVFWMGLTIIGGLSFLGCQAWEWNNLINEEGVTLYTNPFSKYQSDGVYINEDGREGEAFKAGTGYLIHRHNGEWAPKKYKVTSGPEAGTIKTQTFGPREFGALFFIITGFHGFHVFSGVLFLLVILLNVISGIYTKRKNGYEMVEKIGLYWHFVDLVWVFVFLVFYLL